MSASMQIGPAGTFVAKCDDKMCSVSKFSIKTGHWML